MSSILTAFTVGLISVASLAAEGAQERWGGSDPANAQRPYYNSERVNVEGTVELTASGVELEANDGKHYELMYPRFLAEDVEVKDGQNVAVEGYLVPGPRWGWGEEENHLRVEKVTIDGKDYDLASRFGPGYGSRTGGWGPGACWGNGAGAYGPQSGGYGPGAHGPRGGYGGRGHGMRGGSGYRW
jgi:hypothetical protein